MAEDIVSANVSCRRNKNLGYFARNIPNTCVRTKSVGDSAFGEAAPRLWNELPVNIRALSMFRKCLKTYLFIRHFS